MSQSSGSAVTDQILAHAIALRAAQRRAAFEQKAKEAEVVKTEGNTFFTRGDYENAIERYMEAIELNPTEPNYYSNVAAANLKLEQYDEAEDFASFALMIDSCHTKARYRRIQARKSMQFYDSALCDARAMLRIKPNCPVAQAEIKQLESLLSHRDPHWEGVDNDDDWPSEVEYECTQFDPEDWSDSEDSEHYGNNVPCKYYNHDGCLRGENCAFSHAPDDLSERDRLGKNVCTFFLLGNCKFGDTKCNYSHFKAALPLKGWWSDPEETAAIASRMKLLGRSGVLKARLAKHSCHKNRVEVVAGSSTRKGKGKGKGKGKWNKPKTRGKGKYGMIPRWYEDEDEMSSTGSFEFTEEDVNELLSQGVKPWDDDTADVLDVLNGDFY